MASKKELEALIVLGGKIHPSLQSAMQTAQNRMSGMSKVADTAGKITSKAFDIIKTSATIGAVGLGATMVAVGKMGIGLASDLQEVQNVVDVTFGKNAQQINDWSQTALKSFGLSELSAKKYSSTLGALMKSSGISTEHLVSMSENLTALSGDFASFYNLDPAEAFEKIKSGISGEQEPLRALGINMSVANLEAFALSKGIKTAFDKMSQADQTILRYNFLLEKSADAQGDFARTQDSYANQQRVFQESFKQLSATIMKAALPAFTSLFKKGNQLIESFASDPQKIAKLQETVGKIADNVIAAIPTATDVVKKFASGIGYVYDSSVKAYQFIRDNWSTIKPIIIGIVGAMATWKMAMTISDTIKAFNVILDGLTWSINLLSIAKLKDAWATIYLSALYAKDSIVRGANAIATWAMVAAGGAWNIIATIGAGLTWAFGAAVAFLTSPIGLVVLAIIGLIAIGLLLYKNWDKVSAFLSNSWEMIKHGFAVGVNFIVDKLNWLIEKMNLIPGVNIPLIPKIDTSSVDAAVANTQTVRQTGLQQFASGGIATRASIFGEAGPEMAIPLKRTPRSLSLLNQTARAIGADGGGGSPQFVFAPTINGADPNSVKSQINDAGDDFFEKCERWWEAKRRESFA